MTLFTPLVSLLLVTFFSALIFIGLRKSMLMELKTCVREVTWIQVEHRKLTKKLLSLNPLAKKLRIERRSAELAYQSALPPLKPAAYAALQAVKIKQKLFRIKQRFLIKKAFLLSFKSNLKFIENGFTPKRLAKGLEVKKVQKYSDSPDYRLKNKYKKRKRIKYTKRFYLFRFLPSNTLQFLDLRSKYKTLKCGSTMLKKGGEPWRTKLILDK